MVDSVMNLPQLASYLQMSQAAVYHLVAEGKIPGVKVGKQWRFSQDSIDRWLQGTTSGRASVLVVEDDALIQDLTVATLKEAGHRAVGTPSVADALKLLVEIKFDLVFLDLLLPDGSGLDVVRSAVDLPLPPEIVVITGHPQDEGIEAIRTLLPYVIVLNKPVRFEALVQLATRHARQSAMTE